MKSLRVILAGLVLLAATGAVSAQAAPSIDQATSAMPDLQSPAGVSSALKWLTFVTVLSLAPALLVMVTSFTRIIVVLGLLRQALGTQQLPPNQILFGLSLLMTLVIMWPTYQNVNREAIAPYLDGKIDQKTAIAAGESRLREFLIRQIEAGGNTDDVYLFLSEEQAARDDLAWKDVQTIALIPAFVVSELKIAFLIGFQIFLPFVVIDLLVSSVLVSMGMLMLPPVLISMPFKLLLFVLANGWDRVVGTLMRSFQQ